MINEALEAILASDICTVHNSNILLEVKKGTVILQK